MYYTPETLSNHVFEDLWKPKAPNTLISIPECDSSLGIIVFLVGGEHPFLPCHVVCAPAINDPT
jgi:hypothetical protein